MKTILCLLAAMLPLTLFGQAVSRTELRNTNDAILLRATNIANASTASASNALYALADKTFTNIAQMISVMAAMPTNTYTAAALSYYGTNTWAGLNDGGGGMFVLVPTNGLTTNFGTIFRVNSTHFLKRIHKPEEYDVRWFGIVPINGNVPGTTANQTVRFQNFIDSAPNNSRLFIPQSEQYNYGVSELTISNRFGLSIGSDNPAGHGGFPYGGMSYAGTNGGAVLRILDSQNITVRGLAIRLTTPSSFVMSNVANYGIYIDQTYPLSPQITTDIYLEDLHISTAATNDATKLLCISRISAANTENMFGKRIFLQGNMERGDGLFLGTNANLKGIHFEHFSTANLSNGVRMLNGQLRVTGGLGGANQHDFNIDTWTDTTIIDNVRTEGSSNFLWVTSAVGGSGNAPLMLVNCSIAVGGFNTNVPLIQLDGIVGHFVYHDNTIDTAPNQKVFGFTGAGLSSVVSAEGNHWPHGDLKRIGLGELNPLNVSIHRDKTFYGLIEPMAILDIAGNRRVTAIQPYTNGTLGLRIMPFRWYWEDGNQTFGIFESNGVATLQPVTGVTPAGTVFSANGTNSATGLKVADTGNVSVGKLAGIGGGNVVDWNGSLYVTNATGIDGGGSGSGSVTTLKENGSQVGGADIVTLDFLGADFDLSESPDTEVNIVIAAAIARDSELVTATNDAYAYALSRTNGVVNTNVGSGLSWNGSQLSATGSGTPAGNSGALQFVETGAFAGTNEFRFDRTNLVFYVPGSFYMSNTAAGVLQRIDTAAGAFTSATYWSHAGNGGSFAELVSSNFYRFVPDIGSSGPQFLQFQRDNRSILSGTPSGASINVWTQRHDVVISSNLTALSITATGTGTGQGQLILNDFDNSKVFVITTTNVVQNVTNIYMTPWPAGLGWCYQVQSTNNFIVRWTNGPCGGSTATIASVMTQTNFVLNQVYTNDTGSAIVVNAATFFAAAAVNGNCAVELMASPAGGTGWTKLSSFSLSTLLTGLTMTGTNSVVGVVTNTGSFYFTNSSTGAGNSAGLVAGSGQFTKLGGGTVFTNAYIAAGWGLTAVTNGSTITMVPTNTTVLIQTNVTTVTADFSDAANVQMMNTWFHLTTNLVVSPTNLVVGRTFTLRFSTNALSFDVTITNTAMNDLRWPLNFPTNGSTSFKKTNNMVVELYLTVRSNLTIVANAAYYR